MFGTSHAQTSAGAAYLSRPGGQQQRWRREQPRERCRGNAAAARQQGLQSKASSLEIASRLCRLPGKLLQHLQQQRTGLEDVRPAVARAAGRPCAWAAWPAPVLYSKATQQSCQRRQQPGIASSSAASAVTRAAAGPFWAHRAHGTGASAAVEGVRFMCHFVAMKRFFDPLLWASRPAVLTVMTAITSASSRQAWSECPTGRP